MQNVVASDTRSQPLLVNADVEDLVAADIKAGGECCSYEEGSLWGSVFNLCSATLGAGCLSLPHAVKEMGLLPALLLCVLTGFASHLAIIMLGDCLHATNSKSFEELSVSVFGKRSGQIIGFGIFIIVFGSAVAYTIALGDILEPLVKTFGVSWLTRDVSMIFFWVFLMVPLSLVEKVSALRFTSLSGVLALMYLIVAMSVHLGIDASISPSQTTGDIVLFEFGEDTASAGAIILFAYCCQMNVPSIYFELKDRTPAMMRAVSGRAMTICAACYVLIGFVGYADFPNSAQGNLLNNYCLTKPSVSSFSDHPPNVMAPAAAAMAFQLLMAYPLNLYPGRDTLQDAFFSSWGDRHRVARHVGLTFAIAAPSLAIALILPDISVVFSLMGGTATAYVCFVMPAALSWKLRDRIVLGRTRAGQISCLVLIVAGTVVGLLSTTTTIIGIAQGSTAKIDACNASQWTQSANTSAWTQLA